MAKVLLLLDMANLWDSCRTQYGKRARVNFKVLLDKAKTRRTDTLLPYAYIVPVEGKNQDNLIAKLQEMGMYTEIVEPQSMTTRMQLDVDVNKDVDKVVVASSNPAVKEVLIGANQLNKDTMLIAFAESLDKELAQEADDIKLLSKADTITQ